MPYLLFLSGEWFILLLVLFLGICFPIIIGGVIFFVLRRNKLNRAAWNQLAAEIGFHMPNPKQLQMLGNYNGIETRLALGRRTSGSGDERRTEYFTYCSSKFPKPLRFALQISARSGIISQLLHGNKSGVGQVSFDKVFETKCYDPRVLQRLLLSDFPSNKTGNLMGDLMLARQSFNAITLTDNEVYIETPGQVRDHDELKHLLLVTNRLARRFAEARAKFPLEKWEQQLIANWDDFAKQHSMTFDKESIALTGIYNGFPFKAWLHSEPGKWKTSLELTYPQKLMVGFQIYPEAVLLKAIKLFGFQDLKSGHRAFDDAFIVKAKNVQVAKAKLTTDFCDQMVGLKKNTSAIKLDDEGMSITVDQVLGDPKTLTSFINAMGKAMGKLR